MDPFQIDFDISKHWAEPILYGTQDDWDNNLKLILEWSPFASRDDLLQQVPLFYIPNLFDSL